MKKTTLLCALLCSILCQAQIYYEGFDDVSNLTTCEFINVSNPVGTKDWSQGSGGLGSYSGLATSYLAVNAQSTTGTGTISNWFILPSLSLKDGDKVSFYTIAANQSNYPDRLQVRLSINGDSSTNPANSMDLGDFTTLLLDINPTLSTNTYPETYTQYEITLSGIGVTPTDIKLAFRYFVTDGGPTGVNSNGIAIDDLSVTGATLGLDNVDTSVFEHSYDKVSKNLTLRSDTVFEKIELFNIMGQNVLNKTTSEKIENINLSKLNDGIYIAKIFSGKNITSLKFIKH